jgi:putative membrane protein
MPDETQAGVDRSAQMSWIRTRLSLESTLGSWMRTAVSLIGFGFTIFQFFNRLEGVPGIQKARYAWLPDVLSLALVATGTIGLIVVLVEYRNGVRHLWTPPYRELAGPRDRPRLTPTGAAAFVLILIGVFALLMMIMRLG